jgi:hypothetical protein
MAGLDPAIHPKNWTIKTQRRQEISGGTQKLYAVAVLTLLVRWMAGSSPAMTSRMRVSS